MLSHCEPQASQRLNDLGEFGIDRKQRHETPWFGREDTEQPHLVFAARDLAELAATSPHEPQEYLIIRKVKSGHNSSPLVVRAPRTCRRGIAVGDFSHHVSPL